MFKNMKLGVKISLGFAALILIAVVLGGLSVYNMKSAVTESTKLAKEYVPEVRIADNLKDASNRVMYEMRGYGLVEENHYYNKAKEEMKAVKKHMEEAAQLAESAKHLKALKGNVEDARGAVENYEELMRQTEETIAVMAHDREKLDKNAASYMQNCADFLNGQNEAFRRDLADRQKKIRLVTAISDLGTDGRVSNFKVQ